MSTTRLTKQLRSEIADAIYKASKLPAELEEMIKEAKTKAKECVMDSWPVGFEHAIRTFPKEWFGVVTSVYANYARGADGQTVYLGNFDLGELQKRVYFDDPIPFPTSGGGDYAEAYAQWLYDDCRPRYQDWIKRHDELFTVANGVLNSYRTVEKLLKDVPEMGQFIPQCNAAYPVPAVPISNALTTFLLAGVEFKKVA